jgi:hypothetical protein
MKSKQFRNLKGFKNVNSNPFKKNSKLLLLRPSWIRKPTQPQPIVIPNLLYWSCTKVACPKSTRMELIAKIKEDIYNMKFDSSMVALLGVIQMRHPDPEFESPLTQLLNYKKSK